MGDYYVTIAVPIFGVEKYIERCARSLFGQTYINIEYLFVDDCSPDRSIEVLNRTLEDYPERKDHVRIVRHEHNRGLSAARNTAVSNCQTEWLYHIDSDDWIELNTIESLVKKQIETGADIVSGNVLCHTLSGDRLLTASSENEREGFVLSTLGYNFHHILCSRLIRMSLYDTGRIKAEEGTNLGEDWQVTPRLAWNAQKFAHLDVVTYHYDCTNTSSYVNGKKSYNRRHFEQDYRSWEIVNDFFKDKDEVYQKKLFESGEKLLYRYLYLAAEGKDKQAFADVRDRLLHHSPNFFSQGRLGRGWFKSMTEKHYRSLRLSFPVRKFLVRF